MYKIGEVKKINIKNRTYYFYKFLDFEEKMEIKA